MTSMVSEYIIRPALQQVRRFSRSSISSESQVVPIIPENDLYERPSSRDDAISETEEDSYLKEEGEERASQPTSPSSSFTPNSDAEPIYDQSTLSQLRSDLNHSITSPVPNAAFPSDVVADTATTRHEGQADAEDIPMASPSEGEPGIESQIEITEALNNVVSSADLHEPLPEDDGMGNMRRRIRAIQAKGLSAPEQARLIHTLLMESYTKIKGPTLPEERLVSPHGPLPLELHHAPGRLEPFRFLQDLLQQELLGEPSTPPAENYWVSGDDSKPCFAPLKSDEEDSEYRALGCEHYKRNVKSQCSTCERWYVCRFCHDKEEKHAMIAKDVKNMLCMFCGSAQRAGEACVKCGETAAMYYCSLCKLWNNDSDKSIYHCSDCGICRVGRGLGKDFFHCKKCKACLAIKFENNHRCIERLLDCDCPICGDYMFNSPKGICHMSCGHAIHQECFKNHLEHAYKCPICSKSVVNMEIQFRSLDLAIEAQPMPERFRDTRAVVLCNDCSARTTVQYHWLGLKCAVCRSYNTSQLQLLGAEAESLTDVTVAASQNELAEVTTASIVGSLQQAHISTTREIARRRRHSSNLMELSTESIESITRAQDRLARSVSPVIVGHSGETEDAEGDEDILNFWSRVPRSITSNEDHDEDIDSDDDSGSSVNGMDDDDEEEDEGENEISLFGHR